MMRIVCLLLLLTLAAGQAEAKATLTVVNLDGAGEGFNDPTPVAPVGGNPGTTLGEQRLNAFQFAADIWGCILDSDVEIRVEARFNPLSCTATSGTLGSAGPKSVWRDFAGAPLASTWYVDAQADALSGVDQNGAGNDISATFNSDLGTTGCLEGSGWYLGLDNAGASNLIDLVVVLLHEFGHGLGFLSLVNESNGQLLAGFHDVWNYYLYDNATGKYWVNMNDAERTASAISGDLVWDGPTVTAALPGYLCQETTFEITSPGSISGFYNAPLAGFSPCGLTASGPLELVNDGSGTTSDGCEAILNDLTGKIAVIDRGSCTFVSKVLNAQAAGAIGVVVVNNVAGDPFSMGGSGAGITVPAVMVSQADGNAIKAELGGGVTGSIAVGSTLAGADATGKLRMYAPNPVEPGSSISHWDTAARPNLLMEPSINSDLPHGIDLAYELFDDIGWTFNLAPVAVCETTLTVEGDSTCTAAVDSADVDLGTADPNGDAFTLILDPPGPYGEGVHNVLAIASDGCLADTCMVEITVECSTVSVPGDELAFNLGRARPNPFSGRTEIRLSLDREASVRARVYDTQGRVVRTLRSGILPAGDYTLAWDGSTDTGGRAGAGLYFLHVAGQTRSQTLKLVLTP